MSDLLFKFNESKTQGAIRWMKRALEAERTARMNATACDVQGRKNDEFKARVAELEGTIQRIAVQSWQEVDDNETHIYWSECRLCEARIEGDTRYMKHQPDCMLTDQNGEGGG